MASNIQNCRHIWRVYTGHSHSKNYASVVVSLHSSLQDMYIYVIETAKITLICGLNIYDYLQ